MVKRGYNVKYREVRVRVPVEEAIKLELEGLKVGMTLPQYCQHLLSNQQSKFANKRQDEIYEMVKALHNSYFDVEE